MRDLQEIRSLLDELERQPADTLESQDLDFKQWDPRSMNRAVKAVVDMAVCMANGGGGTGRGTYWILRHDLHRRLSAPAYPERDRRIDCEAAKTRVLSVLMERGKRREPGLSNEEILQITHYDRNQSRRLMLELIKENPAVKKDGERRWARYAYSM